MPWQKKTFLILKNPTDSVAEHGMKIYLVGGAVRDALLGLPVQDRDWVVVGGTPQAMQTLGFLPVGKDFPVFLHPKTHEEYALARTERKSGRGYKGFVVQASPEVTLPEDLARRDLTINAMAQAVDLDLGLGTVIGEAAPGAGLIDPWGGMNDLQARVLRHVTPAFREDPVRVLRLARFAARFTDFTVAPETSRLMRDMVEDGEIDHLVPERVWQELARGLMSKKPSRMFEVLQDCGALLRLMPELSPRAHSMAALDLAAGMQASLAVRWACLGPALSVDASADGQPDAAALLAVCERLRVPLDCRTLAQVLVRERRAVRQSASLSPAELLHLLERCDAIRKPQRFAELLLACECDTRGELEPVDGDKPEPDVLKRALDQVLKLDTAAVAVDAAELGLKGPAVGAAIFAARVRALQALA
jgi:tRNA nucleotidyltransferase (CCA-adding enzyme)